MRATHKVSGYCKKSGRWKDVYWGTLEDCRNYGAFTRMNRDQMLFDSYRLTKVGGCGSYVKL